QKVFGKGVWGKTFLQKGFPPIKNDFNKTNLRRIYIYKLKDKYNDIRRTNIEVRKNGQKNDGSLGNNPCSDACILGSFPRE
ncbi:MAG: hypothetical protein J1F04_10535, partial [Oscillospiraceae bacterium]|nr:hypothetical protein [Oscillospiraceae bacterium]